MSTRKVSPRKAALLTAAVLATTSLGSPALAAVQSLSSVTTAAPASTVVSRISVPTGNTDGGNKLLVSGTGLATGTSSFTAKTVKFGTVTVDSADVTALSTTALEVEVPAASSAGAVNVTVGDATKGPAYKYVADDLTVTTAQDDLDELEPSSDTGLTGAVVNGTGFEAANTKVLVGGKPVKATVTSTSLTFALPAGLTGVQDVVVSDPRNTVYVGYVTYAAKVPTVTAVSSYAITEAATAVTLTGTNLDAVTGVTYEGGTAEKMTFVKTTDPTKLTVAVPKGSARADGEVKVVTKYGKSATFDLERKASPTPTVTGASGAKASGGEVTLTGTGLVGLKSVSVTASGKTVAGTVVSVASATSAKVKLPKLTAGTVPLVVKTNAATASTAFTATVADDKPTTSAASINGAKTVVTLTGTYLKGATKVAIKPASGATITRTSGLVANDAGTSLVVTLPSALADGDFGIIVTTPAGVTASRTLTVGEAEPEPAEAPVVTSVTANADGDEITIAGTDLTGATKVTFTPDGGGTAIEATDGLTVNGGGTSLVVALDTPLDAGDYDVVVTTPGGDSDADTLTVS